MMAHVSSVELVSLATRFNVLLAVNSDVFKPISPTNIIMTVVKRLWWGVVDHRS